MDIVSGFSKSFFNHPILSNFLRIFFTKEDTRDAIELDPKEHDDWYSIYVTQLVYF